MGKDGFSPAHRAGLQSLELASVQESSTLLLTNAIGPEVIKKGLKGCLNNRVRHAYMKTVIVKDSGSQVCKTQLKRRLSAFHGTSARTAW